MLVFKMFQWFMPIGSNPEYDDRNPKIFQMNFENKIQAMAPNYKSTYLFEWELYSKYKTICFQEENQVLIKDKNE